MGGLVPWAEQEGRDEHSIGKWGIIYSSRYAMERLVDTAPEPEPTNEGDRP